MRRLDVNMLMSMGRFMEDYSSHLRQIQRIEAYQKGGDRNQEAKGNF